MEFEIDVSGEDILNHDYTIAIASRENNSIIKGFKFNRDLIRTLRARHGEGRYKYDNSKQGKSLFRVRLYCIIIYYLFKSIKNQVMGGEIKLCICKDFQGHEKDITSCLDYFLRSLLNIKIDIHYIKLPKDSIADKYAFIMRKDNKNLSTTYVQISLEEIEKFLNRKKIH